MLAILWNKIYYLGRLGAMKKEKFEKIVTINPYSGESYKLQNSDLSKVQTLSYDNSSYYISLLYPKDFITATIELSVHIDNIDIADAIEIKAYEELGLDQSVDYKIEYVEEGFQADKEVRLFNVFVTEPDTIKELFADSVDKTKFIDYITPAPLLFRQIYKKEILQPSGVHCFFYFTKKDSFVVYFQDGSYIYSKSIKYSLEYIYEQYCSITGERVDMSDFYSSLENEGVKPLDTEKQKNFMKIFGEVFMHLNDVNIYFKRAFDIKNIDNLYIGSILGSIMGLEEYSKTYLGLTPNEFDFNYDINTESWYVDQLHYLMSLQALENIASDLESYECNFSTFFRPPPLYLRKSGQFILTLAAASLLAVVLPAFHLTITTYYDFSYDMKNQKKLELKQEVDTINAQIKQKSDEKNRLVAMHANSKERFEQKKGSLETIAAKKSGYVIKSDTIYMLAQDLNKNNLKVSAISSNNDIYTLTLKSDTDKKITEFIKYVTQTRPQVEKIDVEKISFDEESKLYTAEVEVHVK